MTTHIQNQLACDVTMGGKLEIERAISVPAIQTCVCDQLYRPSNCMLLVNATKLLKTQLQKLKTWGGIGPFAPPPPPGYAYVIFISFNFS